VSLFVLWDTGDKLSVLSYFYNIFLLACNRILAVGKSAQLSYETPKDLPQSSSKTKRAVPLKQFVHVWNYETQASSLFHHLTSGLITLPKILQEYVIHLPLLSTFVASFEQQIIK
jgi:hypothetical protein